MADLPEYVVDCGWSGRNGRAGVAKESKRMRWLLLRNCENLAPGPKVSMRQVGPSQHRSSRARPVKTELREILAMPFTGAKAALEGSALFGSGGRLGGVALRSRLPSRIRWSSSLSADGYPHSISMSASARVGSLLECWEHWSEGL